MCLCDHSCEPAGVWIHSDFVRHVTLHGLFLGAERQGLWGLKGGWWCWSLKKLLSWYLAHGKHSVYAS